MSMTDPIADMLTRIRNANSAYKPECSMPSSHKLVAIAEVLKDAGYIVDYRVEKTEPAPTLTVELKYGADKQRTLTGIRRISKPGLRVFAKKDDLPRVLGGLGIAVISTSRGLMTDVQARSAGIGGEVVAYVW
ncbi:MAG: 30S ribosomal protein S8 [Actinomycetia bacterium]|nr:30S ribosomal protein S8 [Actinomycetes bacterium]